MKESLQISENSRTGKPSPVFFLPLSLWKRCRPVPTLSFLIFMILAFLCSFGFIFCGKTTSGTSSPDAFIKYGVELPSMNTTLVSVQCTVSSWINDDSIRFAAPAIYADNPYLTLDSTPVHAIKILDRNKNEISFVLDSMEVGLYKSLTVSFQARELPVILSYEVSFPYRAEGIAAAMPIPFIGTNTGYLEGNYLFMTPIQSREYVRFWRTPLPMSVTWHTGPDVTLTGTGGNPSSFHTPYELLFCQVGIFSASSVQKQTLLSAELANQKYEYVYCSDTATLPTSITYTHSALTTLIADIRKNFPVLSPSITIISGFNERIGFEGTFSFCLRNPLEKKDDSHGAYLSVLAHEYMHFYIGVLVGETDLPWWKEGTTQYIGLLYAKRNDLCSREYFENALVNFDCSSAKDLSLNDLSLRKYLYTKPEMGHLYYRKGSQITLLIDYEIHKASSDTKSIVDVLAYIYRNYAHSAITREIYLQSIQRVTGADVNDIFTKYVDNPGIIPQQERTEAFIYLGTKGALGTFTSAQPSSAYFTTVCDKISP